MAKARIRVPKKPQDIQAQIRSLENRAMRLNLRIFQLQAEKQALDLLRTILSDERRNSSQQTHVAASESEGQKDHNEELSQQLNVFPK